MFVWLYTTLPLFQLASAEDPTEVSADSSGASSADDEGGHRDEVDTSASSARLCVVYRAQRLARLVLRRNWSRIQKAVLVWLLLCYLAYFSYCMRRGVGNEPSIRLLVGTIIGLLVLLHRVAKRVIKRSLIMSASAWVGWNSQRALVIRKVLRW